MKTKKNLRIPGRGFIRERTFPAAQDMIKAFDDYVLSLTTNDKFPTLVGFFLSAGISRRTYSNYKTKYEGAYEDAQDYISMSIEEALVQSGLSKPKGNAMEMFLLKSQFKYNDRPGTVVNIGVQGNVNFHKWTITDLEKKKSRFLKNREREQ